MGVCRTLRLWCRSLGTWSTGRGSHREGLPARSRFTEGRVSARYQALRAPVAVSIDGERFATEGRGLRTMRPLRRVGIERACPVKGTGRPVIVRTLATLDARATGRRVALPMGANRAAGLQPGGTGRPFRLADLQPGSTGRRVRPWCRSSRTWSTGRGSHRGGLPAQSRFTEGRVSARYQALRAPVAVSIDGERFATEGRGLRTMRPLRRVGIEGNRYFLEGCRRDP